MEGNRRNFLNKRSNPQFKRTGGPRKGKQHNSIREESYENFHPSDTVYRILCQSKKIGSVIGKGGNIVKSLREETQAKITVSDSVPGSDERVIIIFSPSDKQAKRQSGNDGEKSEKGYDELEPHCAAQDASLKVHDRIVEEDLGGAEKGNGDETVVSARLLVSNNMVGCILGRKGDVIQRLRIETGANIRVLPADNLPACWSLDLRYEKSKISGKPAIARKALYEVSTLLHQNPRKDKPPSSFPTPYANQGFHPPGPPIKNIPPGNSTWLECTSDAHRMEPMPFRGGYGIQPSAFGPEDYDGVTPPHDREAPSEFTVKILCSAEKIGGVIGKEALMSQTIDAILHLQNKTSEYSDKGTITTRLLVPSSKVGCILGQGGHVINDMRRRTHADIRVFSKEEKPKCASEDEELVQISGSFGVAKDALLEIASRLRTRCLRDANTRVEPGPVRPFPGNLRGGGLPLSSTIGAGSSRRYEHLQGQGGGMDTGERYKNGISFIESLACDLRMVYDNKFNEWLVLLLLHKSKDKTDVNLGPCGMWHKLIGIENCLKRSSVIIWVNLSLRMLFNGSSADLQGSVREYEPPSFPLPPRATRYSDVNEAKIGSVSATGGSRIAEFAGTRMKLQDPYSTGSDFGMSEHFSSSRNLYQTPASSTGHNNYPQPGAYQSYNSQYGAYPNNNASPVPYQNSNPRPVAYQDVYAQQGSYQNIRAHGSYKY
ncbi:UNVERIFIED_CONTAM: KH domain-containing protein HEN4 [Sesamum radiatum]|uniref:KH domain-containing protein HEN4 n=1 Tax=Sesamum radiatum TaxID=300843 RepID=A0AAW2V4Z6_SESRA